MAEVRVLERIRVAPAPPTPSAAELPITFFDAAWLFTGPVERLFFYRHPDPRSALPLLASSLPHALSRFFPLAGTLSLAAGHRFAYAHGDTLALVLAESTPDDDDFDSLVATGPRDLRKMRALVPCLPPPREDGAFEVAAVQATVFPGRGLCLGVSVHHAACDDASATLFVRTWAAACRLGGLDGADAPPAPVLDRSLVADPEDLLGRTLAGMKRMLASGPPPPPPAAQETQTPAPVIASFPLTRDQIDGIKDAAAAEPAGTRQRPSSFVAASALAWVCLLRSRSVGVDGAARSHMLFSAECRSRLAPPLPAEYFGNCLRPCFVEAATSELANGDGGVAAAAAAIGSAIKEMERGVLEGAEGWLGKVLSVLPQRPMSVGGSPRHGVYEGTDFGWGRPCRVEMVSIEKTPGTVSLAEGPDGEGGVEVGVVLPPDAMEAFASCFRDIVRLSGKSV